MFLSKLQHQQQSYSLDPVPPTFYNPADFAQPLSAFSVQTPSSTVSHVPMPADIFNNNNSSTNTPSSTQFTPISQSCNTNFIAAPTGSATLSPVQMSAGPLTTSNRTPQETVPASLENLVFHF